MEGSVFNVSQVLKMLAVFFLTMLYSSVLGQRTWFCRQMLMKCESFLEDSAVTDCTEKCCLFHFVFSSFSDRLIWEFDCAGSFVQRGITDGQRSYDCW